MISHSMSFWVSIHGFACKSRVNAVCVCIRCHWYCIYAVLWSSTAGLNVWSGHNPVRYNNHTLTGLQDARERNATSCVSSPGIRLASKTNPKFLICRTRIVCGRVSSANCCKQDTLAHVLGRCNALYQAILRAFVFPGTTR